MGHIFFLAGPSGVGKGPLWRTIKNSCPDIAGRTRKIVLHTSRDRRPHEREAVDYYFRDAAFFDHIDAANAEAQELGVASHWIRFDVRSDCRSALNLFELKEAAERRDGIGFLETYYSLVPVLQKHPLLEGLPVTSILLSPLSARDILNFHPLGPKDNLPRFIETIMLRKLIYRHLRQHDRDNVLARYMHDMTGPGIRPYFDTLFEDHGSQNPGITFTVAAMEKVLRRHSPETDWAGAADSDRQAVQAIIINLLERACTAVAELQTAPLFDWVIPNTAGESHTDWEDENYLSLGMGPRQTVNQMLAILRGDSPPYAEKWTPELVERIQLMERPHDKNHE